VNVIGHQGAQIGKPVQPHQLTKTEESAGRSYNEQMRSRPQFREQVRHANNESDISDEDMADVDENIIQAPQRISMPSKHEEPKYPVNNPQGKVSKQQPLAQSNFRESSVGPPVR
jgi:hypothetical protein